MARYRLQMPFPGEQTSGVVRLDDDGSMAAIPASDSNADWREYEAWLAAGNTPDAAPESPPERRAVSKSLIVARLNDAGKLAAAKAALDSNLYARERWYAADKPAVYADDAEVLALLSAIGADAAVILAPE